MVSTMMLTPDEMAGQLAKQAKRRRLALNWSQKTLSERSGVSYGSLKKFERTGQISLISLLKIALILDAIDDFEALFTAPKEEFISIDALMKDKSRKRGRQ